MSRRIKRTRSSPRARDDRKGPPSFRERPKGEKAGFRPGPRPARFVAERSEKKAFAEPANPERVAAEPLPTKVQTVLVTPDEDNMRVDRFLEARFPTLSFSHIQRIVRKGELRVNGKRADSKDRLEAGAAVRIPPLKLDAPKPRSAASDADEKTRQFLRSITLYEDDDVLVLNKPM